jgi:hypothetical protein
MPLHVVSWVLLVRTRHAPKEQANHEAGAVIAVLAVHKHWSPALGLSSLVSIRNKRIQGTSQVGNAFPATTRRRTTAIWLAAARYSVSSARS